MKKDIIVPDKQETGISRRKFLIASGAMAAGYTVGQMATGAGKAFAQDALTPADMEVAPFEWPGVDGVPGWGNYYTTFEDACQEAAIRAYERYRSGGG